MELESLSTESLINKVDYDNYSNKQLLAIPLGIFALAVLVLVGWFIITGSPATLGVEFVGGAELRVEPTGDMQNPEAQIESTFDREIASIQSVPSDNSYIVTFKGDTDVSKLQSQAENAGFTVASSSQISPTFGADSQQTALLSMLTAFVGMSIVVFFLFRSAVPSLAVVASAVSDLVVPLAMMNLVGIELSLGTVAALLMLLGYSVDSDMLLNDYVIRRSGSFYESVYTAMDTGITMTLTSFVAMVVLTVGATLIGIPLLRDIGFVLAVGLLVDIMNTYLMNVSILRWYKFEGVNS